MENEIRKAIEACVEQAEKMTSKVVQSGAGDRLFGIACKADALLAAGDIAGAKHLLMVHGKI